MQGNYSLALDLIRQGLAVAREIGNSLEEARAAAYLGCLYTYLGDNARAQAALSQVLQIADALDAPELRVEGLLPLTILARAKGDLESALAYAQQTFDLACTFGSRYTQAHALVLLGHTQADTRSAPAEASYERAIAHYQALGNAALACEPRAGLAALALAQGDRAQALVQVELIVSTINTHPYIGLDEPFFVYLTCYRVLHALHDPRAATILQAAQQRLREYAEAITDQALRRSFLEHVAAHRDLLRCDPSHGTPAAGALAS
jgi:hypothetical protein